jgi:glycosyltransferase involved in cell wall biosynthesis
VIEAMAHGAPVVTSRGTSTEEVAGGAAVLVDPLDVSSIASGISEALDSYTQMSAAGLLRAAQTTWAHTARATADAYAEVLRGSQ